MNTTLPTFLDALQAALAARGGLAGVNVFSCPVDPEDMGKEAIELAKEVTIDQVRESMASTVLSETYEVTGAVLVHRTSKQGTGSINNAAKAARDRAHAILEELVDEISTNDTMTGTVRDVTITTHRWAQGMSPENRLGRFARVEFTLTVGASVTP